MAKLLPTKYPFPKMDDYRDVQKYIRDSQWALDSIPPEKRIRFHVADGYAYYFVVSLSPLVLQHIDFLDGYAIPDAHMRGLQTSDVTSLIEFEKAMAKLFQENK